MSEFKLRERSPEARDAYFQGYRAGFLAARTRASDLCLGWSSLDDDRHEAVREVTARVREKIEAMEPLTPTPPNAPGGAER